jgi:sec-independent protein translocase protein TatA
VHFSSAAEIFGVDGIIVLVVVVLVLFGSTQIPKLARSLGSAQKEFKKGLDEGASEDEASAPKAVKAAPPPAVSPPTQTTVTVETNGDGSSGTSS